MTRAQRVVIVGGGPAGYEAALVAAELDASVTVVADDGLGGNCVLWDCVPSKALITAAEAVGWRDRAAQKGVRVSPEGFVDRSVVDFPAVAEHVLQLGASQSRDIAARLEDAGVRVIRGRGRVGDGGVVEVVHDPDDANEALSADAVLVATGSRARVLPFFTPDGERVLLGQDVYNLPEVPEHLIVVGSGATGAEFAGAFRRFGADVTLVSSRDLILPTEDPDAAAVIESVFEDRGMQILRNARANRCERVGDRVVVGLTDGREVTGSHVLFTVGQVPATADLGLDGAGVQINTSGGISIDNVCRTTASGVYAAGDAVGRVMLASVAAMQGRTAMWHALGEAVQPIRWDAVAATIFTDPEVATVGWSPAEAEAAGFPVKTALLPLQGNSRAKMGDATEGFVKVHAMVGSGTVVGAVVVARRASDLIQPLSLAVQQRLSVAQLAQTSTVYPSMAGSITECARMLMVGLDR